MTQTFQMQTWLGLLAKYGCAYCWQYGACAMASVNSEYHNARVPQHVQLRNAPYSNRNPLRLPLQACQPELDLKLRLSFDLRRQLVALAHYESIRSCRYVSKTSSLCGAAALLQHAALRT